MTQVRLVSADLRGNKLRSISALLPTYVVGLLFWRYAFSHASSGVTKVGVARCGKTGGGGVTHLPQN